MHLHECPDCRYAFVARRKRRCPKCEVLIIHMGEYFVREEKVFTCDKKGSIEVLELKKVSHKENG